MGLLDFLSGKNAKNVKLLELQKYLVEGSPNKLIFTEEQLHRIAVESAQNSLRIMTDTSKILPSTVNPDVFFSRMDLWVQHAKNLKALEPFVHFTGVSATTLLDETYKQRDDLTFDFLKRFYQFTRTKAEAMKTQDGKNNQYRKFFDSLKPFYGEMSSECIDYIEDLKRNSSITMKMFVDGKEVTPEEVNQEPWYANHPNPKFHRTEQEQKMKDDFWMNHYQEIKERENVMVSAYAESRNVKDIDAKIKLLRKALECFDGMKSWCCKFPGGKLHFEDSWEHLHNSRTPDWSYGDGIRNELSYLEAHREELIAEEENRKITEEIHRRESVNLDNRLRDVLRNNPGIKQTDVYKNFDKSVKSDLQEMLYFMAKRGEITRTKSGSTYVIHYN